MIGGLGPQRTECRPGGQEQGMVGESRGIGRHVGVQRLGSRGPDMLT